MVPLNTYQYDSLFGSVRAPFDAPEDPLDRISRQHLVIDEALLPRDVLQPGKHAGGDVPQPGQIQRRPPISQQIFLRIGIERAAQYRRSASS